MLLVGTAFTKVLFLPFGFKFGSLVMLYAETLSWYDLDGAVALYMFVIGTFFAGVVFLTAIMVQI